MMRAVEGIPPKTSQVGLDPSAREQGYFLPCIGHPTTDMEVTLSDPIESLLRATVKSVEPLCEEIVRITLEVYEEYSYRSGQFMTLCRKDGVRRCYSLSSVPEIDGHLEIHVKRVPGGEMSNWFHQNVSTGQQVELSKPSGSCYYERGKPDQGLLLIGTGSGLAPLYGILRDALKQQHTGPIKLFHGSSSLSGLYLIETLRRLEKKHPQFEYKPCISRGAVPAGFSRGRANEVALLELSDLSDWRIFLCGQEEMIRATEKQVFLAGASMKEIHSDSFTNAKKPI